MQANSARSVRRLGVPAILAFLAVLCLAMPQLAGAAERSARVAQNAFERQGREDLAGALREAGEVRVIVGLQTAQELSQGVDGTPDQVKEQAVAARQTRLLQRLARHNVREVKRLRFHHFIALTVDSAGLEALLADPEVSSVEEDRPNYPVLFQTPGITRADQAWAEGARGAGQTVAIVDTGVESTHPFFSGKVVAEACFSSGGAGSSYCSGGEAQSTGPGTGAPCPDYNLACWHGTHVAGIAAGRSGVLSGTSGIAPDAGVIAIQVFHKFCNASGCSITAFNSDIINALDYVYSLRATYNIASANLSLGGSVFTATCDASFPSFKTVIDSLSSANIATVIASGNDSNAGGIAAPGCISSAVSVGSTTKQNAISSFSNSASFLSLLAPGDSVFSSVPQAFISSGFATASGTSMATPHVTGAWAVLKSAKPTASVAQVLSALQNTGLPITDPRNGLVKPLIQIGDTDTQFGALGVLLGQNVPPTVALTAPANGASFVAPASITLSATATATRAAITRVEFYQGSVKIGTASAAPYSMVWSGVAQGTYALSARAFDNIGGSAASAPVNISVTTTAPPLVISGTVTKNGAPLGGVNFSAGAGTTCSLSDTTTGQYSCTVPQGYTGTVTPSLSGNTFTPSSRVYGNLTANSSAQDYTAGTTTPTTTTETIWVE